MKLKLINATFGEAVTLPDTSSQSFVSSEVTGKRRCDLEYDTEAQLLFLKQDGHSMVKGIGITNIKVMTIESETSGNTSGAKAKGK
jgi:hypothetical protein